MKYEEFLPPPIPFFSFYNFLNPKTCFFELPSPFFPIPPQPLKNLTYLFKRSYEKNNPNPCNTSPIRVRGNPCRSNPYPTATKGPNYVYAQNRRARTLRPQTTRTPPHHPRWPLRYQGNGACRRSTLSTPQPSPNRRNRPVGIRHPGHTLSLYEKSIQIIMAYHSRKESLKKLVGTAAPNSMCLFYEFCVLCVKGRLSKNV